MFNRLLAALGRSNSVARRFAQIAIGAAAIMLIASGAWAKPALVVTASEQTITIANATPGGTGVLIGCEAEHEGGTVVYRQVRRRWTADDSGTATVTLARAIAPRSLWLGFDIATGSHGAFSTESGPIRVKELPASALKDVAGRRKRVDLRAEHLYVLVIRPGHGAWELTTGDAADADRAFDGITKIPIDEMQPVTGSEPLDELEKDDLLAILLPQQMGCLLLEVKQ